MDPAGPIRFRVGFRTEVTQAVEWEVRPIVARHPLDDVPVVVLALEEPDVGGDTIGATEVLRVHKGLAVLGIEAHPPEAQISPRARVLRLKAVPQPRLFVFVALGGRFRKRGARPLEVLQRRVIDPGYREPILEARHRVPHLREEVITGDRARIDSAAMRWKSAGAPRANFREDDRLRRFSVE